MLDVHPPHTPTHTWRDFLIHIATIVVGLLIAVGLEQTVETIHHAHQRRELREALRAETEVNNTWANDDLNEVDRCRLWAAAQLSAVEMAGSAGTLKISGFPHIETFVSNTGVWFAAKQNGEISLLSVSEQTWLTDMYRIEDDMFVEPAGSYKQISAYLGKLNRLLYMRTTRLASGEFDISDMNAEQRLQLDECLRTLIETARQLELDLIDYGAYTEYLLATPPSRLDQSTSLADYLAIQKRIADAHSDLNSVLNSR